MRKYLVLLHAVIICHCFSQSKKIDQEKTKMLTNLELKNQEYKSIAKQIWDFSEVGFQESKSSGLLQSTLKNAGFQVQNEVAGMPTAFVAVWGEGSPTIGILAEFDALPGLSQTTSSFKEPIENKIAGHACGHHLFGTAAVAAAIELKESLIRNKVKGTIKVFGTPAEEGGSGKVYMVRDGLFEGVDLVLHWHPDSRNNSNTNTSLANMTAKFRFKGISAHAAVAPDQGRSALDGVEAMNYMVNMMREHVSSDARIHYVITDGGKAPNVVPDFSEVYYYARHEDRDILKNIFERIVTAAEGAALGTGTKMEYEIMSGVYNLLPVEFLAQKMHSNLNLVGGVSYTDLENQFATEIQKTMLGKIPAISNSKFVEPFSTESRKGGSTDVGDVSWVVPTVGCRVATWVPGTPSHSWQAVACGGTDIGFKGMMVAAKTLALTGYDFIVNPDWLKQGKEEWLKARGEKFKYESLLGNRKPALNYRD